MFRGVDAEFDLIALDRDDFDFDVVSDLDAFAGFPGEYKHAVTPSFRLAVPGFGVGCGSSCRLR